MINQKPIIVNLPILLIENVDTFLKTVGYGANRSAFIKEAIEYYLKLRGGIKFL